MKRTRVTNISDSTYASELADISDRLCTIANRLEYYAGMNTEYSLVVSRLRKASHSIDASAEGLYDIHDGDFGGLYKCKHCGRIAYRESDKAWINSFCSRHGNNVRLMRIKNKHYANY